METTTLSAKFRQFEMLMHREHAQNFRSFGPLGNPSRGQGRILAILKLKSEISQKELGYLLEMRPQSLGELLLKLEKSGYIVRTPSEEDKRAMNITLTEKGREAAEQLDEIKDNTESIFDTLSEEDQQKLSDILDIMIAALSKRFKGAETYDSAHPFDHMHEAFRGGRHPFGRGFCGPDGRRQPFATDGEE